MLKHCGSVKKIVSLQKDVHFYSYLIGRDNLIHVASLDNFANDNTLSSFAKSTDRK